MNNLTPYTGDSYENRNDPPVVLDATASYLLESTYGAFRLTVSWDRQEESRLLALACVMSYVKPLKASFDGLVNDRPTMHLLTAAAVIANGPRVELRFGNAGRMPLRLLSNDRDTRTQALSVMAQPPSRAETDAFSMKNRLREAIPPLRNELQRLTVADAARWLVQDMDEGWQLAANTLSAMEEAA